MADAIEDLQAEQRELEEYVDNIDEDLADLEDEFYEEDVECECDDFDLDHIEIECPECEEIVCFETDLLDDEDLIEITCPNCDAVVYRIGEDETEAE